MSILVDIVSVGMTRGYEDILGIAATITLIAFLIAKELLATRRSALVLGRNLPVAIIPLLTVFAVIVAMKVADCV